MCLLLLCPALWSQALQPDLISPAGDSEQLSQMQLDWTLGDLAVRTLTAGDFLLTEGYLQPRLIIERLTPEEAITDYRITVSPNPTLRSVWLEGNSDRQDELRIELLQLSGKPIGQWRWSPPYDRQELDLSNLPAATYLIRLFDADNRLVDTWKVVRIR